jgi:hypothetical protein
MPKDLLAPRVYRHDAAGKSVLYQEMDDPPAKFFPILRRAEHRHGARMQDLSY